MSNCLYNDKLVSVRCFFTYSCSLFANLNAVVGREDVCFGFLVIKLPKILHDVCIDSALSSVTSVMCLCLNQKCTVLNYYFFFLLFFPLQQQKIYVVGISLGHLYGCFLHYLLRKHFNQGNLELILVKDWLAAIWSNTLLILKMVWHKCSVKDSVEIMLLSLLNEALSNDKTMNFLFAVWSQFFPFVCLSCTLSVGSSVGKRGASDGNNSICTSQHRYLEMKLK